MNKRCGQQYTYNISQFVYSIKPTQWTLGQETLVLRLAALPQQTELSLLGGKKREIS